MSIPWFGLIGLVGCLSLLVISLFQLRWWWTSALVVLVTAAVTVLLTKVGGVRLQGDQSAWSFSSSPLRELVLFLVMLLGMMARMLSLAIEDRRAANASSPGTDHSLKIDRWELVYPMMFAVPTFGALLTQLQSDALSIANVILAFQNGFFWQTILKKKSEA